jgi:hypothetical protein
MAGAQQNRPYVKTALFGAVSIGMYVLLLTRQDLINDNFAKGGLFAFLPIVTAFLFSFVHGGFTGNFWSSLGVEASKKKAEVK